MSLSRLSCMIVLLSLSASIKLVEAHNSTRETSAWSNLLEVQCNFPILEYYTCPREFPVNPSIFLDEITNQNEDALYFNALGATIINEANPVIITVQDTSNFPVSCSDTFWTKRIYTIDDGVSTSNCERKFLCVKPPIRIENDVRSIKLSCSEDFESHYRDWLDNHGYIDFFHCSDPVSFITEPESPSLVFSCSGEARSEVIFKVRDSCGSWVTSKGVFEVVDTLPPTITCDSIIRADISDFQDEDIIELILPEHIEISENCGSYSIHSDFHPQLVDLNCNSEQIIEITAAITDDCGQTETCNLKLVIQNTTAPQISCPPETTINCEDPHLDSVIDLWLAEGNAIDFTGSSLQVENDLNKILLIESGCKTVLVKFHAEDSCHRSSQCYSNISILDNNAPELICPFSFTFFASDNNLLQNINTWLDAAVGSDRCSDYSISNDFDEQILETICDTTLIMDIRFNIQDHCFNENHCTTSLKIINDIEYQIDCVENLVLECGDPDNVQKILEWAGSVQAYNSVGEYFPVSDNININELGSDTCEMSYKVYFRFDTPCGTALLCSNAISFHDQTKPVIECHDEIVFINSDEDINQIINTLNSEVSAYDDCGQTNIENLTINLPPEECEDYQSTIVEYTATDDCGWFSTCISHIKSPVDLSPVIDCPSSIELECASLSLETELEEWINLAAGVDHNGNVLEISNNFSMDLIETGNCEQSISIEFELTDDCGRSNNCFSELKIVDNSAPIVNCPESLNLTSVDLDYENKIHSWLNSCLANDACNATNISWNFSISDFDPCFEQNMEVIFTANDACLNSSQCVSSIYVDQSGPVIDCPAALYLECGDPNSETRLDQWIETASGYDNSGAILELSNDIDIELLEQYCHSVVLVQFLVEDNCEATGLCTTAIHIEDTTGPDISCGDDLNINASESNAVEIIDNWLSDIYTEDCNETTISNDLQFNFGDLPCSPGADIRINFFATDKCGNRSSCSKILRLNNDINAYISCPQNLNITCGEQNDSTIENWLVESSAGDNTGEIFTVTNNYPGITGLNQCDIDLVVQFESQDQCGEPLSCTSVIEIIDNSAPEIYCPEPLICFSSDDQMEDDILTWLESSSIFDACNHSHVSYDFTMEDIDYHCIPEYNMYVPFLASDVCGNTAECEGKITIITEMTPGVTCPVPLSLECGYILNDQLIDDWLLLAEGTDYEGNNLSVSNSYFFTSPENPDCATEIDVLFSVVDQCQFSSSCSSTIYIKDTQQPEIRCPESLFLNSTDVMNLEKIGAWIDKTWVDDNCSNSLLLSNTVPDDFDFCFSGSRLPVDFIVEDQCGNLNKCSTEIIINQLAPELICPENLTVECNSIEIVKAEIENWLEEAAAFDNSSSPIETRNDFDISDISFECQEGINVRFETNDVCNSYSECESRILITDSGKPVLECPPSIQIDLEDPQLESAIQHWLDSALAHDDCAMPEISNDFAHDVELIECNDHLKVMFTAEDDCGNYEYCYSEIQFFMNNELRIDCPDPVEIQCNSDIGTRTINTFLTGYEVISVLPYEVFSDFDPDEPAFNCVETYTQFVTFYTTDNCGTFDECESSITFFPSVRVFVPNVFSPNGDGNNDRLTVFSNDVVERIQFFRIYDRWGNVIYKSENFDPNNENAGWDGKIAGSDAQSAVYTYHMVVLDYFGEESEFTGTITLVK